MPTFYAGPSLGDDSEFLAVIALFAVIATIFGAIHCVAWSFMFPSDVEQLIWCIATVIITAAIPLDLLYVIGFVSPQIHKASRWVLNLMSLLAVVVTVAYIISRLILLVLPFCALRSLPVEVYQTVLWTTNMPHVYDIYVSSILPYPHFISRTRRSGPRLRLLPITQWWVMLPICSGSIKPPSKFSRRAILGVLPSV